MIKRLIVSLITVCLFLNTQAQDYEVSNQFSYDVGTPYTVVDGKKFYFNEPDAFFSLKISRKREIILQKYSTKKLIELDRKVYTDLQEHAVIEAVITMQDQHYLFYAVWDKPNKTEYLYARKIESDLSIGAPFKVLSSKYPIRGYLGSRGMFSYTTSNKYDFYLNYNETSLLIQYKIKPLEKKNKLNTDIIGFFVFNEEMDEIWGEELKMPHTEHRMSNYNYTIDGENNVFFLATIKKSDERKAEEYEALMRVDGETQEITENEIKLDGYKPKSYALFEDPDGYIVMAGLAAEEDSKYGANSIFKVVYDYDGEIESQSNTNFMDNVQDDIKKRKRKKDYDVESLYNMYLRSLVMKEDGSLVATAEYYKLVVNSYTDANGRTRTTYTYYYENILTLKINPEGEIAWARLLPKKQVGKSGIGGMSYFYFNNGGKHYFIYLDHIKNLDPDNDKLKYHKDGAGGFLTAYEVDDETGEVTKLSLFDTKKFLIDGKKITLKQLTMDRFVSIGEGEFIFETYIGKKRDVLIKCKII